MTAQKINTVLIEDSGFMRILLADILRSDAGIAILSTAANGKEGLKKVMELQPDVVITDMVMPHFDGLYVVEQLMEHYPLPVILLSSLEKRNPKIFDALGAGAFEFISKELVLALAKEGKFPLNELVKAAASVNSKPHVSQKVHWNTHAHSFSRELPYQLIAIGASTGGPAAIESILKQLPANLKIPVVIAQHMTGHFLPSFAERLNKISPLKVKLAEPNEVLKGGTVYIAPGSSNMKIVRYSEKGQPQVSFTQERFKEFNYPSADCLLISVAEVYGNKAIGVILTGMGKDGAEGLQAIHQKSGFTIAQDESTAIIFGMPKAAIEAGAVRQVVKLPQIGGFLMSCLS